MRFPARYRTRKGYTIATALAALLPAAILVAFLGLNSGPTLWFPMIILSVALPAALAWWLWPKGRRNARGMVWRGALIVFLSILAGGAFAGVLMNIQDSAGDIQTTLAAPFVMAAMGLIFGTIFTFGIPWLLGIGLSLLFSDEPS